MGSLKKIFSPATVALIGASEKEGSVGRAIMENLLLSKALKIFLVNPNYKTLSGTQCYPTINDVPEQIDLAVIATKAPIVSQNVEECGMAGVEGIIIVSAGFKETGVEGEKLESRIREIRRKYSMRIIGPNCLGVIRPAAGLNASFLKTTPSAGKIAFISQSGALGTAILNWAVDTNIGFSMFASVGSMLDVDFGDLIDFLGDDPYTKSIMIYMEGVGNARKFMSAARGFARNKPIIVLKSGRFSESARAALSHTGSMTGDDSVYDAAFRRAGMVRVYEIADLFNAAEVLHHSQNLPRSPKVAIITNAGGAAVMAADSLIKYGGKLAQLSNESITILDSVLPPYWSRGNPVDVLGDADTERYIQAVTVCLNDPEVDGVLIIYTPQGAALSDEIAEAIVKAAKKAFKPVITIWMGAKEVLKARELFHQNNIPTYETPEEAVKTYFYMYRYGKNLQLMYETPAELPVDQSPPKHHLKALIRNVAEENRIILNEKESKSFLVNYGFPVTMPRDAGNIEEAISAANSIGYPVVIKISSGEISHKSELGGVITGIDSDVKLRKEYERLMKRIKENIPGKGTVITVQKMIEKIDYEIILGAKKDKDFGSVILFGMGGTAAEMFRDFSIGLPPLNQTLALRLMEETIIYKMLQGYRRRPPADIKQLEQIIVSFSNLIVDFPEIAEIDINPLAVSEGKAYALDARIIIDKVSLDHLPPYAHMVITPYPTRYVMPWKMADGTEVLIRPIKPEDEPLEFEMLTTLSDETLRGRFFQVVKNIPHEMLIRFCNIDYDREMAFITEIKEAEKKRIIGIGRLIIDPDFRSSEFAVVIHDDFQGKGLGYKLVDMLIGIAQEKGLSEVTGNVLTANSRMLQICGELGFKITYLPDGVSRCVLALV